MTVRVNYLEGWRLRALIFSIVAATTGYLAFSLWGGWNEVVAAFVQIGLVGTLIALSLSLVNYGLRFCRWQLYLSQLGHCMAWPPSLRIYLSGFALTTTPGKAGEAFRGVLLKQRGVPFPATFAAFISERLSDLVAIVLLTLVGLAQYPQARGIVLAGVLGIVVVLACLSSQTLLDRLHRWALAREGKLMALIAHVSEMLGGARRCHRPGLLGVATVISVIAWGAEALAFYWVLGWLGADISLSFAIFVYALSMLAGALSFLPGGLGSAEAVMVSLLVLKGMTMPTAIAATVFIRLATLWFAVLIGLLALIRSRHGEASAEEAA
ncbi:lysylphosphatidylglycerol synthase transmembrane domain-containing protein [Chromohalobacter israelensis]|uniref:lysylphosphatidylglycerol synthase transmembrane domain-containing protein n=1 Tax=Chromohalobacter israelensis TaxID=141390 RepID=UPI00265BAC7A|nr:lysylphosphatidylglycerol synthase transmembrane domain-containing protein [Chromohalobacter salexigens]MDO0946742.1 lysylphosphatidylglycerol synthase transmembrane domain-containing protein [Chromohalobacter salexigens]